MLLTAPIGIEILCSFSLRALCASLLTAPIGIEIPDSFGCLSVGGGSFNRTDWN